MARSLRLSASAGAFVLSIVCSPAVAQNQGGDQITVPFSSLSAAAQQEIIALQRGANRTVAADPLPFPLEQQVSRSAPVSVHADPVALNGSKARMSWAIGVYR